MASPGIGNGNRVATEDRHTVSIPNQFQNVWGSFSVNYGSQGLPDWVVLAGVVLAIVVAGAS